jgi:hypothetical protein
LSEFQSRLPRFLAAVNNFSTSVRTNCQHCLFRICSKISCYPLWRTVCVQPLYIRQYMFFQSIGVWEVSWRRSLSH